MDTNQDTLLEDFSITQLDLVLREKFMVLSSFYPNEKIPKTIKELAAMAEMSHEAVIQLLKETEILQKDIEISCKQLDLDIKNKKTMFLLDVRSDEEILICSIPGSIPIAHQRFEDQLEEMKSFETVVCICHHGVRSLSAAMGLRELGLTQAKSLQGGVDQWAQVVDPSMPQY